MRVQLTQSSIVGARLPVGNQMEAPPCKAHWPLCLGCSPTTSVQRPIVRSTVQTYVLTMLVTTPASVPHYLQHRRLPNKKQPPALGQGRFFIFVFALVLYVYSIFLGNSSFHLLFYRPGLCVLWELLSICRRRHWFCE